jgi:hypothetical protein
MFRPGGCVIAAVLFCAALTGVMWAQGTRASISGVVRDPTGAAVPAAELSLRSLTNSAVVKATSGADGFYAFPDVVAAAYDLTVAAKGFHEYIQRGISINLDQQVRIDISLELGATSEAIEVTSNASPLNFDSAVQKGTIQPNELEQLPLILGGQTRTAVSFARLLPGVTTGGDDDKLNFNTRINGGTNETDEALLDGVSIVDGSLGQNGIELAVTGHPMSPDAIQEITLLTSNYDAQYGYTSSSVLTAITKSGTNSFHGTAYELLRNTDFNARPFGVAARPVDKENDFGGNIGGPLKLPGISSGRKKAFFFTNYEGFRIKGASNAPRYTVPTAQERAGDFSDWPAPIYDPATTQVNPSYNPNLPISSTNLPDTRQQFMGCNGNQPNVICASDPRLVNSAALAWLKYLPMPNLPGIIDNYTPPTPVNGTVNADSTVLDVKGDFYWHDNDHFTATVHYFGSFGNGQHILPVQIDNDSFRAPNYDFANRGNWDHIFRPNLINTFNIGYNDILSVYANVDSAYGSLFPKIPGAINSSLPPVINFQNYLGFGSNASGATIRPARLLNDRLAWVKGKHTLGFGGEIRWLQDKEASSSNESGTYNFTALSTGLRGIQSGNDFASFLLGYVDNASVYDPTVTTQYIRQKYYASYVNDSWKLTPKLTLDFGVRWDISNPTREKYNNFSFVDPYLANPEAGGLPGSLVFAGNIAGTGNPASFGKPYPETTDLHNVAPRFGFAYALTPNTVVRGGYGVFYQPLTYPGWNSGVSGGRDGFNTNVILSPTNGGITPATLFSQGFTDAQYQPPPFYNLGYDNGKYPGVYREFNQGHLPSSQQWNLTVEHQFTKEFYVDVAYVANKGTHLISGIDSPNVLNPSLLSMGNKLYDTFQPGQTSLDGVQAPYAGWVQQLTNGQCAPTVAQALLPFPQFCGIMTAANENLGFSSYNSLQVKAERRMSRGLMFLGSYTWSKFLSSGADQQFASVFSSPGLISPYQESRNKSLDAQDVPQSLSLTALYDIPMGRGHRFMGHSGFVGDKLFSGWEVNGIFRAQSGIPFFIYSSQCNIPSQFGMGCLPGVLPGANPFVTSVSNYNPNNGPLLNRDAFQNGADGGVFSFDSGSAGRISNLRQSPFTSMNCVLQKNTRITEKVGFQIRAEFFNLFNLHFFTQGTTWGQGAAFVTDLGSPLFGTWTGAVTTPRNIQLGGRVSF